MDRSDRRTNRDFIILDKIQQHYSDAADPTATSNNPPPHRQQRPLFSFNIDFLPICTVGHPYQSPHKEDY